MFRSDACSWCARWDQEVGRIYPKTVEASSYPLRLVDVDAREAARAVLSRPIRYTPTFVLAACGKEIGRITGYPGEEHFWGLLVQAIEQAETNPQIC